MHQHPSTSVLIIDNGGADILRPLVTYLEGLAHLHVAVTPRVPEDLSPWQVVAASSEALRGAAGERLSGFVKAGGGWLNVVQPETGQLPALFGVQPEAAGPVCELRVLFETGDHPLSVRLPDGIYVRSRYRPLALKGDQTEVILYADWRFGHSPVLVGRPHGVGAVACTTLSDFSHPVLCQILYRLIRRLAGCPANRRPLGVGIVGYAPSVGQLHGRGAVATEGFDLRAACDLNPERLAQAEADFPEIKTYAMVETLCGDADVDVAIVATPPNTHASVAVQLMAAGKHVVCEKPLALRREETEAMAEMADRQGVHLSCHQNRRWDVDYLAIRQALAEDRIGELFYLETFVGGYGHPCGYWHSDAAVSGGTTFDWGGHYIDWLVGLCPGRIASVSGTRHNRVWHDVTNADQERIQIRFDTGVEADFMHSEIAAARKPKWYLLGTRGAIVGRWRNITEYQIDPLHYFQRHDIPATEMPPDMTIYCRQGDGKIAALKPGLPDRPIFGFHRNLADHLLIGEPLVAPLADSMRVVAVLEAAARSMVNGGRPEVLDV